MDSIGSLALVVSDFFYLHFAQVNSICFVLWIGGETKNFPNVSEYGGKLFRRRKSIKFDCLNVEEHVMKSKFIAVASLSSGMVVLLLVGWLLIGTPQPTFAQAEEEGCLACHARIESIREDGVSLWFTFQ